VFFKISNFKILLKKFSKFQNSKNGMYQVSPNCNFIQNFSSLALKEDAIGVAQISPYSGGGPWPTEYFFALNMFLRYKMGSIITLEKSLE
jgi:hypothetical protein